jgi:hypothetical protein
VGYKVFICYRRVDRDFARNIERELVGAFGDGSVFLDTDEIQGGQRWKHNVLEVFKARPVVVTLMTGRWNSRRNDKPKLLDEADHIRFELECALEQGLPIVPVLYEPAKWPKSDQLPPTLEAVLGFQRVPFSNERWRYDADQLVRALTFLGIAPAESPAQLQPSQASPPSVSRQPQLRPRSSVSRQPQLRPRSRIGNDLLPPTLSQSMFRESQEARKARLAAAEAAANEERERKERARAAAAAFYVRWEFWLAAVVTVAAGAAAVVGAELLIRTIVDRWLDRWVSLPAPPIVAGVVLVAVWAGARIGMGAAAYRDDPGRGVWAFYQRGLLGGYTLWLSDWEPVGVWTAFPIATVLSWFMARGIAWPPYHYLHWSYNLIFWLVLSLYTLFAVAGYVALTLGETLEPSQRMRVSSRF